MKRCARCGKSKPTTEFNKRTRSKDGLQTFCRACSSLYYQANAVRHKQNVVARNKRVLLEIRQRLWDYLKSHPCVDCGETDPVVLEFDHVRGEKKHSIAMMIGGLRATWPKIEEEIAKCEVRCSNCHQRRTAVQLGWYRGIER